MISFIQNQLVQNSDVASTGAAGTMVVNAIGTASATPPDFTLILQAVIAVATIVKMWMRNKREKTKEKNDV